MKKSRSAAIFAFCFTLGVIIAGRAFAQNRQEPPPEQKEIMAALKIEDLNARLKELERIKTAHPGSLVLAQIDNMIVSTKIGLCPTVDAVAELQKPIIAQSQGFRKIAAYYSSTLQILTHKNLKQFDKKKVTEAVIGYADTARKTAADPEVLKSIPADQQKYLASFVSNFHIAEAQAYLNEDSAAKALEALAAFNKETGEPNAAYYYSLASADAKLGKIKEAYENYFEAAAENYEDAVDKAREYYQKLNGKVDGFETKLEAKWRELPYPAEPFKPTANWKGKTVLAEIFTGSECPPCVGADLGFDGLSEAYGPKYVAILEYHLPIPRPDPMMNPATKKRQDYYGVNSTPTTIIDGDKKVGGGNKAMAEGKFKEYSGQVNAKLYEAPAVVLKAGAKRNGDVVKVDYSFDKIIPNAEYHLALIQKEEKYRGSNGIVFHKLVVRDFKTVDPSAAKQASFDLAANENATDRYLTEFEKTYDRIPNFRFAERHHKIDRTNLGIVFFVQDKETKKVFNAAAADVK